MNTRLICATILYSFAFYSCSVGSQFVSPNQFRNIPATVFLHDGDTLQGQLSINNEVLLKKIKLRTSSESKEQNFHLLELSAYKIDQNTYQLKHRMDGGMSKSDYFMKRLTPASFSIHLYEHKEKHYQNKGSKSPLYKTKYFVQFPNEHRNAVWALDSERLVPHFHQKMSEVVAECPGLAKKILAKEKGYSYQHFNATEQERLDVAMRIAKEFNSCKEGHAEL